MTAAQDGERVKPKNPSITPTARGSYTRHPALVAEWVGGKNGYLWLGTATDDPDAPRFVTALSAAQARQLRDFLVAQTGGSPQP